MGFINRFMIALAKSEASCISPKMLNLLKVCVFFQRPRDAPIQSIDLL